MCNSHKRDGRCSLCPMCEMGCVAHKGGVGCVAHKRDMGCVTHTGEMGDVAYVLYDRWDV